MTVAVNLNEFGTVSTIQHNVSACDNYTILPPQQREIKAGIYLLHNMAMAIELPPWAFKAIEKVQKRFVWRGRKDARGGHCLLAWPKVAHPKELGGLGIYDVRNLSRALRARWLWLQKTDPNKPWAQFQIQTCKEVQFLFDMALVTEISDGSNTLFWKDRWLHGKMIKV
jgi:hypothetical protein